MATPEKTDFIFKYKKLRGQCIKHLAKLLRANEGTISFKLCRDDRSRGENTTCHIYNEFGGTDKAYIKTITLKGADIIVSGIYAQSGEEYTKSIDALCEDDVFWLFDGAYDAAPWKCKELHKSEE